MALVILPNTLDASVEHLRDVGPSAAKRLEKLGIKTIRDLLLTLPFGWETYGAPTPIEWIFKARPDGTTFVSVTNRGFPGNESETVQHALDSTEGFALVLAGAKALLEHNVILNLVRDRFPDGIGKD